MSVPVTSTNRPPRPRRSAPVPRREKYLATTDREAPITSAA